jgi:hypothetical protein
MINFVELLDLKSLIEQAGFGASENFENIYDKIASDETHSELRTQLENRVYEYFSGLSLPDAPTIYDYLILALREKDVIATFNWDPFLIQAYLRNERVTKTRRPRLCFLHGNVEVGICVKDRISGINGRKCSQCGDPLTASKLLYPVRHKDYASDPFISGEWAALRHALSFGYYLTIFGYSAPASDVEARKLMLEDWKKNPTLDLAEVDVIDIKTEQEVVKNWNEFFVSHHYGTRRDIFGSYLFMHPRRSCEAFAEATLMLNPWQDNTFPRFATLKELQDWTRPLVEEEEKAQREQVEFSGNPLSPKAKKA